MISKNLSDAGKYFLFEIISSTPHLRDNLASIIEKNSNNNFRLFQQLPDEELYSRLLSDIDFQELPKDEQDKFLFFNIRTTNQAYKEKLYSQEMCRFIQEAHARSCEKLGVKPTNVIVCDFRKNALMDEQEFSAYDVLNGNIYINSEADYSSARPSILLESINERTLQHFVYQNLGHALVDPAKVSDACFYLAVTTAIKNHVYQESLIDETADNHLIYEDAYTPDRIFAKIYSFIQTRQDLQAAGIYGGYIRDQLREEELKYHANLRSQIGNISLLNTEDMFALFKESSLNVGTDGKLGKVLDRIDTRYTPFVYNALGASIPENFSVSQYLDKMDAEIDAQIASASQQEQTSATKDAEQVKNLEADEGSAQDNNPPSEETTEQPQQIEEEKTADLKGELEQPLGDSLVSVQDETLQRTTNEETQMLADSLDYKEFNDIVEEEGAIFDISNLPYHPLVNIVEQSAQIEPLVEQ